VIVCWQLTKVTVNSGSNINRQAAEVASTARQKVFQINASDGIVRPRETKVPNTVYRQAWNDLLTHALVTCQLDTGRLCYYTVNFTMSRLLMMPTGSLSRTTTT
jgi:hypothetical protein